VLILAILLKGQHSLSALVEGTGLSKNALVNHLGLLIDSRLVQRVGRGNYALTADGEALISSVATIYRDSALREEERLEKMRSRYTVGLRGEGMSERVISKPAVYQPLLDILHGSGRWSPDRPRPGMRYNGRRRILWVRLPHKRHKGHAMPIRAHGVPP